MNKIFFISLILLLSLSACKKPISGEEYVDEHVDAICNCMQNMVEVDKMGKEVGMTTDRYLEYMKAFEGSTQKVNTCFAENVKPIVEKIYLSSQKKKIENADLQAEVDKYNDLLGKKLKAKCPDAYELIGRVDKSVFEWQQK
jgi:hypothetical protein